MPKNTSKSKNRAKKSAAKDSSSKSSTPVANGTPAVAASKSPDIRNFFNVTSKSKFHSNEDVESPVFKRSKNSEIGIGVVSDSDVGISDDKFAGHLQTARASSSSQKQPPVLQPGCPKEQKMDLVDACHKRQAKIVLTRL